MWVWLYRLRWVLLVLLIVVIVGSNVLYYGELLPWIVRGGR
jgi:hypothetical protein